MFAFTSATAWNPVELRVRSDEPLANPAGDRTLTATFEHESGTTHGIDTFEDGEATRGIRFSPTRPGRWEWHTASDPSDDGLERAGSFLEYDGATDDAFLRSFLERYDGGPLEPRQELHDHGDTVRAACFPDDDALLVYTLERREVRIEVGTVLDGNGDVDWLDPETRRRVSVPIEDTEALVVAPAP
ncbi:DUF5060 domain-containing protein [Halomontanus rarus]|uniref:DUF5060 domain-containing protein n=1 Tax=Halomontanus rarus TaxID=3034020 RepID=UPI001A98DBE1